MSLELRKPKCVILHMFKWCLVALWMNTNADSSFMDDLYCCIWKHNIVFRLIMVENMRSEDHKENEER